MILFDYNAVLNMEKIVKQQLKNGIRPEKYCRETDDKKSTNKQDQKVLNVK